MKGFKIIYNGRTPKWHWQIKWCKDYGRHPAQQPWWLKAHWAWVKENKIK